MKKDCLERAERAERDGARHKRRSNRANSWEEQRTGELDVTDAGILSWGVGEEEGFALPALTRRSRVLLDYLVLFLFGRGSFRVMVIDAQDIGCGLG